MAHALFHMGDVGLDNDIMLRSEMSLVVTQRASKADGLPKLEQLAKIAAQRFQYNVESVLFAAVTDRC